MTGPRLATCLSAALIAGTWPPAPAPAAAQLAVFDPQNYAQNLLSAARALQQVNNQLTALQNQAQMLQNQARQLKSLDYSSLSQISSALTKIDQLMAKAEGVAFSVSSTQATLDKLFPASLDGSASTGQLVALAKDQAKAAMSAYRQALQVQSQVVENVQGDAALINQLVGQSQGATGGLQAQQAANQLQALAIKQDQQLQTLIAAQGRADALERARQAQVLEAGKLAARRFIGDGQAYTPN
ncbi:P-type conjugative transfer protein TrbJ [Caulobacter sp. 602-2]|uniref:P-type conjugative transfer protein TrbJ n=1 Tax=Caulobacter sp. 602-2 TaxID=2710887 RepID=A0A6G4QUF3_9CAUL|nr:P-type conjugative transfer protein TrbJ [Caulobacter sp. 602-2]NGM49286.1 P-type conjugative transfer protein TrbJ [Caulobacter sp. 602-2]